jgi:hypothetical protein
MSHEHGRERRMIHTCEHCHKVGALMYIPGRDAYICEDCQSIQDEAKFYEEHEHANDQ